MYNPFSPFYIKTDKWLMNMVHSQLAPLPWPYSSLWGEQIRMSVFDTAHRQFSKIPEDKFKYQRTLIQSIHCCFFPSESQYNKFMKKIELCYKRKNIYHWMLMLIVLVITLPVQVVLIYMHLDAQWNHLLIIFAYILAGPWGM